jgi:hypothetical protein
MGHFTLRPKRVCIFGINTKCFVGRQQRIGKSLHFYNNALQFYIIDSEI